MRKIAAILSCESICPKINAVFDAIDSNEAQTRRDSRLGPTIGSIHGQASWLNPGRTNCRIKFAASFGADEFSFFPEERIARTLFNPPRSSPEEIALTLFRVWDPPSLGIFSDRITRWLALKNNAFSPHSLLNLSIFWYFDILFCLRNIYSITRILTRYIINCRTFLFIYGNLFYE